MNYDPTADGIEQHRISVAILRLPSRLIEKRRALINSTHAAIRAMRSSAQPAVTTPSAATADVNLGILAGLDEKAAEQMLKIRDVQADHLMKAAGYHLDRVGKLADTEWKVTLAFWAAMIASGASLIGIAGSNNSELAYLIYAAAGPILLTYLAGVSVFIFGFSSNQSQSIATERNRFLAYESAALSAAGVCRELCIAPATPAALANVVRAQTRLSPVWAMKLVSSSAFAFISTGVAVTIAGVRNTTLELAPVGTALIIGTSFTLAAVVAAFWIEMTAYFIVRAQHSRK